MSASADNIVYEYNADNELLSAGDTDFEFDLNGNMVSKKEQDEDETQYVYNKMGKMVKLISPIGKTTKYYYRHDGLRNRKTESDGDEIHYYWGAGVIPPLLSERKATHGSSAVSRLASYPPGVPGFKLFGKQSGMFYYLTDHLGSVYYVTDAKANIINSYDYDEFGVVTTKNEHLYLGSKLYNTKGFTGEPQHQEEDGLIYLRQRYYSPETGRFITRDKFLVPSFVYCLNNPVIFTDHTGEEEAFGEETKITWKNKKYGNLDQINYGGNPRAKRILKYINDKYSKFPKVNGTKWCNLWAYEFINANETPNTSVLWDMSQKLRDKNTLNVVIIPYLGTFEDKHQYTYLQIIFINKDYTQEIFWLFTESDKEGHNDEPGKGYNTYFIKCPDKNDVK